MLVYQILRQTGIVYTMLKAHVIFVVITFNSSFPYKNSCILEYELKDNLKNINFTFPGYTKSFNFHIYYIYIYILYIYKIFENSIDFSDTL